MARWPREAPLAALLSCESSQASHGRSRWSVLAQPEYCRDVQPGADPLSSLILHNADNPASPRDSATTASAGGNTGDMPPFLGGWIGSLSYDMGAQLEPTATSQLPAHAKAEAAPIAVLAWCPDAYVHDNQTDQWWRVGRGKNLPSIQHLCSPVSDRAGPIPAYRVDHLRSSTGRDAYQRAVARCIEYILSGDAFQANIAHTIEGRFTGDTRSFFLDLAFTARPWYGAYLETKHAVIASASPEMFLRFDAGTRRLVTRPMKGTRDAADSGSNTDLVTNPKDHAELTMIVDLMRNDLGRVCEYGSVHVEEPRSIEHHGGIDPARSRGDVIADQTAASATPLGGVLQGVGTVSGTLRHDLNITDVLKATFPPGSVTGAPKVRAMQIIDELELARRGAYCGAIGYISCTGDSQFSVAIRTAIIERASSGTGSVGTTSRLSYSVGAGIVAESVPEHEWTETLVKAGVLLRTLGVQSETINRA